MSGSKTARRRSRSRRNSKQKNRPEKRSGTTSTNGSSRPASSTNRTPSGSTSKEPLSWRRTRLSVVASRPGEHWGLQSGPPRQPKAPDHLSDTTVRDQGDSRGRFGILPLHAVSPRGRGPPRDSPLQSDGARSVRSHTSPRESEESYYRQTYPSGLEPRAASVPECAGSPRQRADQRPGRPTASARNFTPNSASSSRRRPRRSSAGWQGKPTTPIETCRRSRALICRPSPRTASRSSAVIWGGSLNPPHWSFLTRCVHSPAASRTLHPQARRPALRFGEAGPATLPT